MTKKLYEISADLVQAQVSTSALSSEEIVESLKKVFNTLSSLQRAELEGTNVDVTESVEEPQESASFPEYADPMDSIQQERIICLECGAEMRQLTAKHLNAHGLSIRDYKKKWGFPLKQSLSAKSLSKARSKAAKKRGLPPNLIKYREERKTSKAMESAEQMALSSDFPANHVLLDESEPEFSPVDAEESKKSRKKSLDQNI